MNGKVLVVMEIPKAGNERVIAIYEQGVYVGLSIGGWELNGTWVKEVYHVTEFEWYEVSLTDIPANENALLLEQAKAQKPVEEEPIENEEPIVEEEPIEEPEVQLEKEITKEDLITLSKSIIDNIRGIN